MVFFTSDAFLLLGIGTYHSPRLRCLSSQSLAFLGIGSLCFSWSPMPVFYPNKLQLHRDLLPSRSPMPYLPNQGLIWHRDLWFSSLPMLSCSWASRLAGFFHFRCPNPKTSIKKASGFAKLQNLDAKSPDSINLIFRSCGRRLLLRSGLRLLHRRQSGLLLRSLQSFRCVELVFPLVILSCKVNLK